MNHKNTLISLIALCLWASCASPTNAVVGASESSSSSDSTPSAVEREKQENSTISNIKKVIQEKKVELGSATANLRKQRAYLAKVLRVSEETLTVVSYSGNKIIPLEEGIIIKKGSEEVDVGKIAVGDWVGIHTEMVDDNLRIKRISVYDHDFSPRDKTITLGSIASIGKNDVKITPRSGEKELNFSFDKKTKFENYKGEEAKLADFYKDLQCLIVAFADKNGNYVVSTIRALSTFEK